METLGAIRDGALEILESFLRSLPLYSTRIWTGRRGLDALRRDDCETALKLWRPLASDEDPEANYQLGLLYASGRCVDRDMTKVEELMLQAALWEHRAATRWFKQEARAGNANAQFLLAKLEFNGLAHLSVLRHLSARRAEELLKAAAEQGHAEAQVVSALWNFGGFKQVRSRLARVFLNRRWSARLFFMMPPMNQAKAMSQLEGLARSGNLAGMYALAYFHENGFDLPSDPAKAFHWMMEAAQGGHVAAQLGVARYFWDGVGTEVDRGQARRWFDTAKTNVTKDAGCDAHCLLVGMLIEGVGCERDLVQAYYWAMLTDRRFPRQVARSESRKLRRKMTKEQIREGERLLASGGAAV